jgi:hypothetical protein
MKKPEVENLVSDALEEGAFCYGKKGLSFAAFFPS